MFPLKRCLHSFLLITNDGKNNEKVALVKRSEESDIEKEVKVVYN